MKVSNNAHIISGVVIMLIAFYISVDWQFLLSPPEQYAALSLFTYLSDIISGLLPTFLGIVAGILIFKGVDKSTKKIVKGKEMKKI